MWKNQLSHHLSISAPAQRRGTFGHRGRRADLCRCGLSAQQRFRTGRSLEATTATQSRRRACSIISTVRCQVSQYARCVRMRTAMPRWPSFAGLRRHWRRCMARFRSQETPLAAVEETNVRLARWQAAADAAARQYQCVERSQRGLAAQWLLATVSLQLVTDDARRSPANEPPAIVRSSSAVWLR